MPHFTTSHFASLRFPLAIQENDIDLFYDGLFASTLSQNQGLIWVKFTQQQQKKLFFLQYKHTAQTTLIKIDKISKVTPIEIAKIALFYLARACGETHHNLNLKGHLYQSKIPHITAISDFLHPQAKQAKALWLEIGFGSGRHLLYHAKHFPHVLHIGLEIHRPSLEQVARQIALFNLKNLIIFGYDARIFLQALPSAYLEKIFLHFPIPWDKHPKRRIISHAFFNQVKRTLSQHGIIQIRTDSQSYFEHCLKLAKQTNAFSIHSHQNQPIHTISKYEARWRKQDKNIYELNLTNNTNAQPKATKADFSFAFDGGHFIFKKQIHKKEHFFVSINNAFTKTTQQKEQKRAKKIIKVCFGDFNYPETRYIIVQEKSKYFPSAPLPTEANLKAHELLCALLKEN